MCARRTRFASLLASMVLVAALAAAPAAPASTSTNHSGTTSDGGSWVADVPSPWNGTVLLYSHGFGPPQAADAPDPATKQALLDRGYALVGSSYDPAGSWWALGSALRDQFEALDAVRTILPSKPREVIAFGTSMGGLISALESEQGHGRIDGALTTCGLVAGAMTPQQLPAGRRVRARQAAGAGGPDQARALRRPGRGPCHRQAVRRDRTVGAEHARGPRAPWRSRWPSECPDLGARPTDAGRRRLRRPGAAAVRHPVQRCVHDDGLHRVRAAMDRAGRGR